jgi:hypothetical protein
VRQANRFSSTSQPFCFRATASSMGQANLDAGATAEVFWDTEAEAVFKPPSFFPLGRWMMR